MLLRTTASAMIVVAMTIGPGPAGADPLAPAVVSPSFRALARTYLADARDILARLRVAPPAEKYVRAAIRDIDATSPDVGAVRTPNEPRPGDESRTLADALRLLASAHEKLAIDDTIYPETPSRLRLESLEEVESAIGEVAGAMDLGDVAIERNERGMPRFVVGERPFVPIGVNDLVEATTPYKTFDMFDTQRFDLDSIDRTMRRVSDDGYDTVRIWLKGFDTDDGFAAPGGTSFDPDVWKAYVRDIDATIASAGRHGLHVVLTGSFPGPDPSAPLLMPKNYVPAAAGLPDTAEVAGINRLLLVPEMTSGLGRFYTDLFRALVAIDPTVGKHLFYVDLYNEIHFDLRQAPFSLTSGSFTFQRETFELGNAASRQALMDRATRAFAATLASSVNDVLPATLVTASSGMNLVDGRTHFDGGLPNGKDPDGEMLRPYDLLAGGAEIVDIHTYTSLGIPEDKIPPFHERAVAALGSDGILHTNEPPTDTSISANDAPLVAGEFGAELVKFGVTASDTSPEYAREYATGLRAAILEMRATERDAFCAFGFSGFGIWAFGTPDGAADTFNIVSRFDPHGIMARAFDPKEHPVFCGRALR